ncbi:MAG TPA: pyridoxal-phosphate dependent enzyme, partial [Anaerolineales bacterium]|nr:pyridoxal-phosphate dependent enzyme [Anaerolineales bacterium]
GAHHDYQPFTLVTCPACGNDWLEPGYNYPAFKREILRGLPGRPNNLWRYHDVLPVTNSLEMNLNSAGGTPLQLSRRYAQTFDHPHIYIKDERHNPTSSFKDRQAAVSVAAMLEADIHECVLASTGNAAVAYASACARAGIKLWVFMTSLVPQEKLRETALFGAEVIKVSGTYDQAKQIAADFAARRGLLLDRGAKSIPAREAFKTIAYEIVEQLGWRTPDWYIQSVSGGLGPLGVYHGFHELQAMGLIDRVPAFGLIQAEGCAPMVAAFKAGHDTAAPVVPETRIAILSTGDPGKTYTHLWRLAQQHGGTMESVSDREAFDAMHKLAKTEGMAVEPAAAVAFAGLEKLVAQGVIKKDEIVVVNCTGHTFPVVKHVLGEHWGVDVHLSDDQKPVPREGLAAALEQLDEKTTTVLIIDDSPNDALLIRRLLEAKKKYRVFHASDPVQGLAEARARLPDLIVSDLTMPGMDGFTVIEELRRDKRTHDIPVIVVSAKDISAEDRKRLSGQIEAVYQKGSLSPKAFVEQIVQTVGPKRSSSSELHDPSENDKKNG